MIRVRALICTAVLCLSDLCGAHLVADDAGRTPELERWAAATPTQLQLAVRCCAQHIVVTAHLDMSELAPPSQSALEPLLAPGALVHSITGTCSSGPPRLPFGSFVTLRMLQCFLAVPAQSLLVVAEAGSRLWLHNMYIWLNATSEALTHSDKIGVVEQLRGTEVWLTHVTMQGNGMAVSAVRSSGALFMTDCSYTDFAKYSKERTRSLIVATQPIALTEVVFSNVAIRTVNGSVIALRGSAAAARLQNCIFENVTEPIVRSDRGSIVCTDEADLQVVRDCCEEPPDALEECPDGLFLLQSNPWFQDVHRVLQLAAVPFNEWVLRTDHGEDAHAHGDMGVVLDGSMATHASPSNPSFRFALTIGLATTMGFILISILTAWLMCRRVQVTPMSGGGSRNGRSTFSNMNSNMDSFDPKSSSLAQHWHLQEREFSDSGRIPSKTTCDTPVQQRAHTSAADSLADDTPARDVEKSVAASAEPGLQHSRRATWPARASAPASCTGSSTAGTALRRLSCSMESIDCSRGSTDACGSGPGCGLGGGAYRSPLDRLEAAFDELRDRRLLFHGEYNTLSCLERRRGRRGVVQFVEHCTTGKQMAVKCFLDHSTFVNEVELFRVPALRALMHAMWDAEENTDCLVCSPTGYVFPPFVIMARGKSLRELPTRRSRVTVETMEALGALAMRLAELHSLGWVHGNVNPGNVLWMRDRRLWTLTDFGSAARVGFTCTIASALPYSPPECIAAVESGLATCEASTQADVWALGIIAYELLTGEPVFSPGMTPLSVCHAIMGRAPLPWEMHRRGSSRADLPEPMHDSVMECLQRDPSRRPSVTTVACHWRAALQALTAHDGEAAALEQALIGAVSNGGGALERGGGHGDVTQQPFLSRLQIPS